MSNVCKYLKLENNCESLLYIKTLWLRSLAHFLLPLHQPTTFIKLLLHSEMFWNTDLVTFFIENYNFIIQNFGKSNLPEKIFLWNPTETTFIPGITKLANYLHYSTSWSMWINTCLPKTSCARFLVLKRYRCAVKRSRLCKPIATVLKCGTPNSLNQTGILFFHME